MSCPPNLETLRKQIRDSEEFSTFKNYYRSRPFHVEGRDGLKAKQIPKKDAIIFSSSAHKGGLPSSGVEESNYRSTFPVSHSQLNGADLTNCSFQTADFQTHPNVQSIHSEFTDTSDEQDGFTHSDVESIPEFTDIIEEQDNLDKDIDSLLAVLRAQEQRHRCEVLYAQGRINDAAETLVEILNTANEAVRTNELIITWLTGELQWRTLGEYLTPTIRVYAPMCISAGNSWR